MADLIHFDLFEEIHAYFQANNLSSYDGYAHKPVSTDPTSYPFYYFELTNENSIDVFDFDSCSVNGTNRPFLTFVLTLGTVADDATDYTLKSANLAQFEAQKAIREELYNYRQVNTDDVTYPLHNSLYTMTIDSIIPVQQEDGLQGCSISEMTITVFYNK